MLASPSDIVPGEGWAFEVKWDGARAQVHTVDGRARVYTRRGREVTAILPELEPLVDVIGDGAIVDGELVVQRPDGSTHFEGVMSRLIATRRRAPAVTFVAFDLLADDGRSLDAVPYAERRRRLERRPRLAPSWYVPDALVGGGSELFLEVCRRGLEGVVAKRLESLYRSGTRVREWLKLRNTDHPAYHRVAKAHRSRRR